MEKGSLGEAGTGEAPAVHLAAPHGSWKLQVEWELKQWQLKKKRQVPNTLTWICLYYSKPWLLSKCRSTHCFSMTLVVMMSNLILVLLCLDKTATVLTSDFDLHFDFKSLDMSKSVWKIGRKRECTRITILYIQQQNLHNLSGFLSHFELFLAL